MSVRLVSAPAALLIAALAVAVPAAAQAPRGGGADDEETRQYVESLRRTDPAAYEKFVVLRGARDRDFAELVRLQGELKTAGPNLRALVLPQLRAARRRYADSAIALLDFLDAQDRKALAEFQRAIREIDAVLAERQKARAELEALKKE